MARAGRQSRKGRKAKKGRKATSDSEPEFLIRQHDQIGAIDADADHKFLEACFVDTGVTPTLLDVTSQRTIVVGRTGSGKTALLLAIAKDTSRVARLEPEQLALDHILNSNILRWLVDNDVRLDSFFKLLWRHALTVEVLRMHFGKRNARTIRERLGGWIKDLADSTRGRRLKRALNYLEEYGSSFFKDFDHNLRQITERLETDICTALGIELELARGSGKLREHVATEQITDVVARTQEVVDSVRIRELGDILELLRELFDEDQSRYYVVIDHLDEDWIDDELRYSLIRQLIETARDFLKTRHCKIILALRNDLFMRVLERSRRGGLQREKYKSLCAHLHWSDSQLQTMLARRVEFYLEESHPRSPPETAEKLFPRNITGQHGLSGIDYMIKRSLRRPRDVIEFANLALSHAAGKSQVTKSALRAAEEPYSRGRLAAIQDEWDAEYPTLARFAVALLQRRGKTTKYAELLTDEIRLELMRLHAEAKTRGPPVSWFDGTSEDVDASLLKAMHVLYLVGAVGLKRGPDRPFRWAADRDYDLGLETEESAIETVMVHPMLWRVLGIPAS